MNINFKDLFKLSCKIILITIVVILIIFVGCSAFAIYMTNSAWPWERYYFEKEIAAYLKDTYSENMEITAGYPYETGKGYTAFVKTTNKPINFEVSMKIDDDSTSFHDNYYIKLSEYVLSEDLENGLKNIYNGIYPMDFVRVSVLEADYLREKSFEISNLINNNNIDELKQIFRSSFTIDVFFSGENFESGNYSYLITDEDIINCLNYILECGYGPYEICFDTRYLTSDENKKDNKYTYDELLSVRLDEDIKLESIGGDRAEDEYIKNALAK